MTVAAAVLSDYFVHLKKPHARQEEIRRSKAKRRIVRAGRRGGKTTIAAHIAVEAFLDDKRVLYGVPTTDQIQRFWTEVSLALAEPIHAGLYVKNETLHSISRPGKEPRIRAKTCLNADTLRGDYTRDTWL